MVSLYFGFALKEQRKLACNERSRIARNTAKVDSTLSLLTIAILSWKESVSSWPKSWRLPVSIPSQSVRHFERPSIGIGATIVNEG